MKGVIIIAVGEPIYGKMAFNLAVSIKHNSRIPVCVIYTPSAFVGNENLLSVFDKKRFMAAALKAVNAPVPN